MEKTDKIKVNIKVRVIVFNTTFNNISVISSVLLMGATGVPRGNH